MITQFCLKLFKILCCLCTFYLSAAYADIDEIKASGKLRVGVCTQEQPPFYYKNKNKELVGIDIRIIRKISEELGVKPEFVIDRDTWDEVVQDVENGRTDIAASYISITAQRAFYVAFSLPYIEIKPVIVLNRMLLEQAQKNKLMTLNQMFQNPDYKLITLGGSSYYTLSKAIFNNEKIHIESSPDDTNNLNKALIGEVLGYITDEVQIENAIINHPEYKLHIITYPINGYSDQIALPVSYKNPVLLSVVNSVLQTRKMYYSTEDIIQMLKLIHYEK